MKKTTCFLIFSLLFLISNKVLCKEISINKEVMKLTKIASGLKGPWGFDFISSNEILVNLKAGQIFKVNIKSGKKTKITGAPIIKERGQGGLLDLRLSPSFLKNKIVYFSYSKKVDDGVTTALAQGVLTKSSITNLKDIFIAKTRSTKGQHFGSRISFDDKYIFLSVGDRGYRHRAQMLDFHNGKIIRLNMDGTIPSSNPFIKVKDALAEIYSYGHRNPQGLFYDKSSKKLWAAEHGPRGGDEINLILKGKNYGWPVITYGKEYFGPSIGEGTAKKGMQQPKYYYVPSIAPCDLLVYSGKLFKSLKGALFQGALKLKHLNVLIPKKSSKFKEVRVLANIGRVRSVRESKAGEIFFSTDSGQIYKLSKSSLSKN